MNLNVRNKGLALSSSKGFTLIELLVVIAIIGILAGVVIGSLNQARQKARDTQRIGDIKEIELALELYADASSGKYPISTVACPNTTLVSALVPTYLNAIPSPPNTTIQSCYDYAASSDGSRYHLGASLETQSGALTEDRDCNSETVTPGSCWTSGTAAAANTFNATVDKEQCGDGTDTSYYCYDVTN